MEKRVLIQELLKHRYAHRGLHAKPTIPENSMAAFARAVEAGYGIELDLHLTRDGKLAVIHDASLKRTCGVNLKIEDLTLAEARDYPMEESDERIPEFCDFLRLVDGKVPLVVELKAEGRNEKALTDAAMRALADYTGLFCVESFSPAVVDYLKKAYPAVVRGQLAGALNKEKKTITRFQDMLLKNLLVNLAGRPDFVAYRFEDRDEPAFCHFKGAKFMWTIRSYEDLKTCEAWGAAPIFEQFEPKEYENKV